MTVSYVTSWSTILPSSSACSLVSLDVARRRSAGSRLFSLELTSTEASVMRTCIQQEWVLSVEHAHALYNQTLPWSTEWGLRVAHALYNHTFLCPTGTEMGLFGERTAHSFPAVCKKTPTEQKKSGRLPSSTSSLCCDTLHILETDMWNSTTVHLS